MIKICPTCGNTFKEYASIYCSRLCYESSRNNKLEITCKNCGNNFLKRPSDISKCKRSQVGFCCRKCYLDHAKQTNTKVCKECQVCGTQYKTKKNRADTSKFCSYICKQKAFHAFKGSGEDNKNYRKGSRYYRQRAFAHYSHECFICKSEKSLHVHHIDESHQNNSIENLRILCHSCHRRIHSGSLPPEALAIALPAGLCVD